MSNKAVGWAIEQRIPSLQKLVLIMLAERHNRDTGRCDPSIACLADDCGMSKDAVRNALDKLIEAKLISKLARSNGERQISNFYRLAFDGALPEVGSRSEPLGVVGESYRGSRSEPLGVVGESYRGVVAETDTNLGTSLNLGNRTLEENPRAGEVLPPEPVGIALSRGKPLAVGIAEVGDLARKIVCAHPRALLRNWGPEDIPWGELAYAVDAIDAEAERASCSQLDAARFLLALIEQLAKQVPRAEWRYLKPPGEFFRLREYRMDAGEFTRSAGNSSTTAEPRKSFAEEEHERSERAIREAHERRAKRG